jgi:phage FluMu protein Com
LKTISLSDTYRKKCPCQQINNETLIKTDEGIWIHESCFEKIKHLKQEDIIKIILNFNRPSK